MTEERMAADTVVACKMPVETPLEQYENGDFYFQTCITPGGCVGGVILSESEIVNRLQKATGKAGSIEYDGQKLWFVPS